MKKIKEVLVNFFTSIWLLIKKLGSIRGIISFLIVWLLISGSGLIVLGWIFDSQWLIGIGVGIYGFWLAPFTPLIPINLFLALLFQRFILLDRSISIAQIKEELAKVKKDRKKKQEEHEKEEDLDTIEKID